MIETFNSIVIICGRKDTPNTRDYFDTLSILYGIETVTTDDISLFMKHYTQEIELECQLFIPNQVTVIMQKYVGLLINTKSIHGKRGGHDSVIIHVKNKPYLFIFCGENYSMYFNDSIFIPF